MIHDSPDLKSCKELKLLGSTVLPELLPFTIYMPQTKSAVLYFTSWIVP